MIQLGLRLHDAEKLPLPQLLPLVREKGYTCAHMALTKSLKEYPCTPAALTPGYALWLKRQFAQNGIDLAILGNYLNLAHPDEAALKGIQEMYYAHIRFAALLGCGMVGTETGAPNAAYKYCPECRSDAAFKTFITNLKPVVRCAEQYGVTLAIEPVAKHIIYSPARARQALDEIASPNLQILFDPVNLLDEHNHDHADEIVQEAIELFPKEIAMLHLKDYIVNPDGGLKAVGAGTGLMRYERVMRFVKAEKPFLFATLENTTPDNAVACREAMQKAYDEA